MPVSELVFDQLRDRVAKVEERMAVREETLRTIEIRLGKIEVILSRLTWLMVTGIGGSLLVFIIGGGLHVPLH